ncbi:MAG: hypothetical protein HUU16_08975 [Candidatus Omnitrophica bacterium]|nr:hypothetical protein [bacterium]NUN96293.1 hypothetical protein [Candidatus Omnitrophota bacterium]
MPIAKSMRTIVFILTSLLLSASPAFPCAVCFGAKGSRQVEGMNAAIFVMLGVLLVVLLAFAAFAAVLGYRSARRFEDAEEPLA